MNEILSGISSIQGVIGSVVFSRNGQCLGSLLSPPYEPVLFTQFFSSLRSAEELFSQLSQQPLSSVVLRFDAGYLYLRSLKDAFLAVLAHASANLSMVSVGCNVAILKLEAAIHTPVPSPSPQSLSPARGISSRFPALGVQEQPATVSSQFPVLQPKVGESPNKLNVTPKNTNWSSSTLNLSKSSTESPSLNAEVPPDAVGRPVIEALLKALARQIGPFAKVYIKDALARLGASASTVTYSQYNDLVGFLAERITEAPRQKAFVTEAASLLPKK